MFLITVYEMEASWYFADLFARSIDGLGKMRISSDTERVLALTVRARFLSYPRIY
jgi:hypothetical protein